MWTGHKVTVVGSLTNITFHVDEAVGMLVSYLGMFIRLLVYIVSYLLK